MNHKSINSKTLVYGVIGDPITHSLSPVMHNACFNHINYNGVYLAFNVKNLPDAIKGMKGLGIHGLSVTIPHKIHIMQYIDSIDPLAIKIGAVNTVIQKDSKLLGYNSDCLGAVKALLNKTEIKNKKVALIGAGGAARAIGFGITDENGILTIVNRSSERGESLAKELNANFVCLSEFDSFDYNIIINSTSLGMFPDVNLTPVNKEKFHKDMVVMDIVYNPIKTKFLQEAEQAGCTIIDGIDMFIYQGAFQFELWTGEQAPLSVMRKAVISNLPKS